MFPSVIKGHVLHLLPLQRQAREAFLISKGKTLEPYGMNISILIMASVHISAFFVYQPITS